MKSNDTTFKCQSNHNMILINWRKKAIESLFAKKKEETVYEGYIAPWNMPEQPTEIEVEVVEKRRILHKLNYSEFEGWGEEAIKAHFTELIKENNDNTSICIVEECTQLKAMASGNVKQHVDGHVAKALRKFACATCPMTFTRKENLKAHIDKCKNKNQ